MPKTIDDREKQAIQKQLTTYLDELSGEMQAIQDAYSLPPGGYKELRERFQHVAAGVAFCLHCLDGETAPYSVQQFRKEAVPFCSQCLRFDCQPEKHA